MRHERDTARRHAENTIAEANRHLNSGRIKNPRHHQMLTSMIKDATDTIKNLADIDDTKPYTDTNIGYGANIKRHNRTSDAVAAAIDAIRTVLPRLTDDLHDNDMDDIDDMDDVENRRGGWRPRRTRRGVGRFTQVRTHVRRRPRRRADMDDGYNMDDRYSDRYSDRYDDDMRYDDVNRTADDARHAANEARRSADDARRTADEARRAADNARNANPVMARNDETRGDMRHDLQSNRRYTSDDTGDRTHRTGPDARN